MSAQLQSPIDLLISQQPPDFCTMPSLLIDIPPRFRLFVQEQVLIGGLDSVSDFMRLLILTEFQHGDLQYEDLLGQPAESASSTEDWEAAQALLDRIDVRLGGTEAPQMAMTSVPVILSQHMSAFIDRQSAQLKVTAEQFLLGVLEQAYRALTVDRLVLEGVASGPAQEINDAFFDEMQQVIEEADNDRPQEKA